MVFSDWIQLSRAAQCSARHSQFGRLEYWQTVLHPSSNQYVLFKFLQMFTQESWLKLSLSPDSSGYYLSPPMRPTPPQLRPPARRDFLTTKSPCSERAMGYAPPLQVGQPNRAIRQDIHHYPMGWSKWPWCSLHTQFQIPLGSIMGRFKQQLLSRPSHLILSVWCSAEKENNTVGTGEWGLGVGLERVSQQVMKAQKGIKME